MNTFLEMEKIQANGGLGELSTFIGLPAKSSARELTGEAEELFKGIVSILNNLLLSVLDHQNGDEFIIARDAIFDSVTKTHWAMGNLARVIIPAPTLNRLVWQSFAEMEAEFSEHGLKKFGPIARDQGLFTIWTLRRINRLLTKIVEGKKLEGELAEKDRQIARQFSFYASWAQFHLECMMAAMRFKKSIHPDVLETICDGLRAAVNAYGFLRQGLELRSPSVDDDSFPPSEWNEEDEELLKSSMNDMKEMVIEGY